MKKPIGIRQIVSLLFLLSCNLYLVAGPAESTEEQQFPVEPGNTLIIENDYGRIRILGESRSHLDVTARVIAADADQLDSVTLVMARSGNKVFVRSYFHQYEAESVYLDISAPSFMNVLVWGANPAVEVSGMEGYVRAQSLTGLITAENLYSSSSLATETGNIVYRSSIQPSGDIRMETQEGNIQSTVTEGLNLRSWLRAGDKLLWNEEVELSAGSLEKQIGIGGPLFYATSALGDVTFRIQPHLAALSRTRPPQEETIIRSQPAETERPENVSHIEQTDQRSEARDEPSVLQEEHDSSTLSTSSTAGSTSSTTRVSTEQETNDSSAIDGGYALRVNVDWIYLNVSVRDSYTNRAVDNLQSEDFRVLENGVEQRVDRFISTEAPFSLLLLLDVSGSTRGQMDLIQDASIEFTQLMKPADRIAIATFNSKTRLIQDFTNDRDRLESTLRRIRSGGGTAFYDALERSINEYMNGVEGRKAIVVFSDGVDNRLTHDYSNGSRTSYPDLFRQIQEIDTLIYTIFVDTEGRFGRTATRGPGGTLGDILGDILRGGGQRRPQGRWGSDPAYEEARRELQEIADQTGGRMYSPRKFEDLGTSYAEIARDLRTQYTLGYHSSDPAADGEWRDVEVEIPGHSDYLVRTRKGYYAPKR